ncbi:MAG: hypothetical protein LKJ28_02020, partial [Bifidobacteriaceae bacterium]|nr:hypothetical protein [Bifidobacteriaceae bacterium]
NLRELTFSIIDAAFAQRRKTLRAALKGLVTVDQLKAAGIDPSLRGEKLSIDDFIAIAQQVAGAVPGSRPKVVSGLSTPAVSETLLAGNTAETEAAAPHRRKTARRTFLQIRTPAKINVTLHVGMPAKAPGTDDDANDATTQRSMETVYCSVGLYDDVELTLKKRGAGFSLDLEGDNLGDLVLDTSDMRDNLAVQALFALAKEAGKAPNVGIRIAKRIPVSGGLGSASADAAAVLVGLNELWELGYSTAKLRSIGASLRPEVAFCITGGVFKGSGAGDIISPIDTETLGTLSTLLASSTVLLGTYHEGLSTPDVYAEFDRQRAAEERPTTDSGSAASSVSAADLHSVADSSSEGTCHNDLGNPVTALYPRAGAALHDALSAAPGVQAFISGSGPTVVACLPDAKSAWKVIGAWKQSRNVDRIVRVEAPAEISISSEV